MVHYSRMPCAVHCISHRLELALKDCLLKEKNFKDMKDLMIILYYQFKRSGKLKRQFKELAKVLNATVYAFPKIHGTRFINHVRKGLTNLLNNWPVLKECLEKGIESGDFKEIEDINKEKLERQIVTVLKQRHFNPINLNLNLTFADAAEYTTIIYEVIDQLFTMNNNFTFKDLFNTNPGQSSKKRSDSNSQNATQFLYSQYEMQDSQFYEQSQLSQSVDSPSKRNGFRQFLKKGSKTGSEGLRDTNKKLVPQQHNRPKQRDEIDALSCILNHSRDCVNEIKNLGIILKENAQQEGITEANFIACLDKLQETIIDNTNEIMKAIESRGSQTEIASLKESIAAKDAIITELEKQLNSEGKRMVATKDIQKTLDKYHKEITKQNSKKEKQNSEVKHIVKKHSESMLKAHKDNYEEISERVEHLLSSMKVNSDANLSKKDFEKFSKQLEILHREETSKMMNTVKEDFTSELKKLQDWTRKWDAKMNHPVQDAQQISQTQIQKICRASESVWRTESAKLHSLHEENYRLQRENYEQQMIEMKKRHLEEMKNLVTDQASPTSDLLSSEMFSEAPKQASFSVENSVFVSPIMATNTWKSRMVFSRENTINLPHPEPLPPPKKRVRGAKTRTAPEVTYMTRSRKNAPVNTVAPIAKNHPLQWISKANVEQKADGIDSCDSSPALSVPDLFINQ
ncbi:hypothetical protein CAPTEDRAFT_195595 [Capitella teleta]|uniref:Uncharacterized protein n=1 Tax=Capitella teleta TaxID=283909 RepID=R7UHA9_CAPTE|nr:hypothetical protein CAPTEDRAFT_195595 [Capitella teleta]|eukprot:ELU03198.1 hypothetical protein CAPTEDRAFT_195595 [Capitella teleta]